MGRCRVILTSIAVLCAVLATAQEQRASVPWSVSAGFGGLVPVNQGLVPVVFRIENAVASTSGVLRLWQKASPLQRSADTVHELALDLPAPSTREYVVHLRLDPRRPLTVSATFDSELVDIKQDLTLRPLRKACVLAVDVPEDYLRQGAGRDYQFVSTARDDLISDPLAYDAVFAVMLEGMALTRLTRKQADALRRWVLTGGRLIVVGRYAAYAEHETFRTFNSAADMGLSGTGVHRCGAGMVAIDDRDDYYDQPIWLADEGVGRELFPSAARDEGVDSDAGIIFTSDGGVLAELVASLDVSRQQTTGAAIALLAIVLGYLACIGPVDLALTARLRNPRLTWTLFPVGIFAFSGLAAIYGRSVHHQRRRALAVTVLDVPWQGGVARGNTTVWMYSPRHQEHVVRVIQRGVVPSVRDAAGGVGRAVATRVRHGGEGSIAARIPAYSSRTVDVAWYADWDHAFEYIRKGAVTEILCPESLPVNAVHIVSERGMLTCHYSWSQRRWWRADASVVPWQRWACSPFVCVRDFGAAGTRVASRSAAGWGTVDRTAHYIALISSIHDLGTEDYEGDRSFRSVDEHWARRWPVSYRETRWGGMDAAFSRSPRERALNIGERFSRGRRVAFLVLAPGADVAPIQLDDDELEITRVTVVRLQLPDDMAHSTDTPGKATGRDE